MGGSQSLFTVIGVIIMELDGTRMIRQWYTSNHFFLLNPHLSTMNSFDV